ncbi:hypothetical protein KCV00_g254, partial [Aureobasidium melanogenum]
MAPFTCSRLPRRPAARDIDDPHNRLSTARVWGSSCTFVYSADSDLWRMAEADGSISHGIPPCISMIS